MQPIWILHGLHEYSSCIYHIVEEVCMFRWLAAMNTIQQINTKLLMWIRSAQRSSCEMERAKVYESKKCIKKIWGNITRHIIIFIRIRSLYVSSLFKGGTANQEWSKQFIVLSFFCISWIYVNIFIGSELPFNKYKCVQVFKWVPSFTSFSFNIFNKHRRNGLIDVCYFFPIYSSIRPNILFCVIILILFIKKKPMGNSRCTLIDSIIHSQPESEA